MKKISLYVSLFVFGFLALAQSTYASPMQFIQRSFTNATGTPTYITPGLATTSLAIDTAPGGYALSKLVLVEQQTASSTGSILNTDFEFSPDMGVDCTAIPTGCDWYKPSLIQTSSTSPTFVMDQFQTQSWKFASSSQGRAGIGANANRDFRVLSISAPMRYIRAIFTVPIGATNAGVWAMFIGTKEIGEK